VLVGVVGLAALISSTGLSSAEFWGNSWPYSNSSVLTLNVANTMDTSQPYGYEMDQAMTDWANTSTPVLTQKVCYGCGQVITARGYSDSWDIAGYTTIYSQAGSSIPAGDCADPCSGSGQYGNATIEINRDGYCSGPSKYLTNYPDSNYSCFNKVTNHELGHAIGLGHTGSCYAVMKQGPYSVPKTPSNNDMYNANRLYPGYTQVSYTC